MESRNKKYLFLIFGIILISIFTIIIYFVSKPGKKSITTPPASRPAPSAPRVEDQIIVKFKPEISESTKTEILKRYNAAIIKRIDAIHRIIIQVPKGQVDAILNEMKKDNLIEEAEPDYINQASFVPNDPSLNFQWGLRNTGQTIKGQKGTPDTDINAESAWDVTKGSGVKIAILDSGIDTDHPDFSSKIIAHKDFIGTGIDDQYGHGTHVAGIAAASTNNSIGISGTCPACGLIIGKVLNDNGSGPDSVIIQGIIWASDQGAKVINMSFTGAGNSTAKQDAIDYAWNKGAVLVAAAGNNSDTNKAYPAANNRVIAVAAIDNNDQIASFSNYGTWVDVAAPGKAIYSSLPTHAYNMQLNSPGLLLNYDYLNGTSMASPMVSGVVALIWTSSYGTSNAEVVQRLYSTADKISGTGIYWLYGRVNAGMAVSAGVSVTPTPTFTPTPTLTPTSTPTQIPSITPSPTSPLTPTVKPSPGPISQAPTIYCLGTSCQPTPTLTPTPTPSPAIYPTLIIYCLGSCPRPSVMPTATTFPSTQPLPSRSPIPSEYPAPTVQVTISMAPSPTSIPAPKKRRNIFQIIRDFILRFIQTILQFLLKLFGLGE